MAMYPTGQSDRDASTAQLKEDLKNLSQTVEELMHATADDSRNNIKELRSRAEKRLHETRARLELQGEKLYHDAREEMRDSADHCNRYVHDNPWTSVGIGAAVGVVVGMLIGRR